MTFRAGWRWTVLLLLLALPAGSGCTVLLAGAAAGIGGAAYAKGDVERTYPHPVDIVWNATMAALAEAGVVVSDQAVDQFGGRIEAWSANHDRIRITLAARGAATELKLRVNCFGKKQITAPLIQSIEARLAPPGGP